MDDWFRIYAWFLLVVTALLAAARLARPRELAQIMLLRYQDPLRRRRARLGGFAYLALSLLASWFLMRSPQSQRRWLTMAVLAGAVSALEFVLNSGRNKLAPIARQNRIFGGVYASIAIAVALLLVTR